VQVRGGGKPTNCFLKGFVSAHLGAILATTHQPKSVTTAMCLTTVSVCASTYPPTCPFYTHQLYFSKRRQ
jgi:hypothetical protein